MYFLCYLQLEANEILNIDAIIEGALHKCVIHPLKHHIYKLFVEECNRNGSLKLLSDNIKYARTKTTQELGIKVRKQDEQTKHRKENLNENSVA